METMGPGAINHHIFDGAYGYAGRSQKRFPICGALAFSFVSHVIGVDLKLVEKHFMAFLVTCVGAGAVSMLFSKAKGRAAEVIARGFLFISIGAFLICAGMVHAIRVLIPWMCTPQFIGGVITFGLIAWVGWLAGYARGRADEHRSPTDSKEFFPARSNEE